MGQESGDREPGNFGLDPLNIMSNPQKRAKYELQEVKNGRLAMWAAAGMIMQGVTTDGGALDNLLVRPFFHGCRSSFALQSGHKRAALLLFHVERGELFHFWCSVACFLHLPALHRCVCRLVYFTRFTSHVRLLSTQL